MIKTELTRENALQILEMGRDMAQESPVFRDEGYNPQKIWQLLEMTLKAPNKCFICYDQDDKDVIRGFIFGYTLGNFFSDKIVAHDFAMYVRPEFRKSSTFGRLKKVFEQWARDVGADAIELGVYTGLESKQTQTMLERQGYTIKGVTLAKEIT